MQFSVRPLCPALWASEHAHAPYKQSTGSHSPPVTPAVPLTSQGDLSSLCQTPGLWCPICDSNCSLPREDLCLCLTPSSSESPGRLWLDHFPSLLTQFHVDLSYSLGYIWAFLPVSSQFSVRKFPQVDVFLKWLWDRWVSHLLTPPAWLITPCCGKLNQTSCLSVQIWQFALLQKDFTYMLILHHSSILITVFLLSLFIIAKIANSTRIINYETLTKFLHK